MKFIQLFLQVLSVIRPSVVYSGKFGDTVKSYDCHFLRGNNTLIHLRKLVFYYAPAN